MSMDDCFLPLPSPLHDSGRLRKEYLRRYKGNSVHAFPEEEPKQHQVQVSRAASKGRYARFKENLNAKAEETKQHHHQVAVSCSASKGRNRAGWMSHERSTPEGINMKEHAWRFRFPFPELPKSTYRGDLNSLGRPVVMKQRKPLEVRNALRERRVAAKQKAARYHAEVALRKYNRANNTKFELLEVKVISIFSEFGGAGAHYNFTAKQPDADSTKLFFSEVDLYFRSENDVIMCCIVEENDAGHCYGCKNYQPVIHPSSEAYGGGSSTCIDYPYPDSESSDSD
ncbi:uncharacterized protein LOC123397435 [Hordeum vulgare subsp. vulgare]|nr:uncharacterized protein LOC123397435 [Hordeum vulgare subsp. vulgare]